MKHNWWIYGVTDYWRVITDNKFTFYKGKTLDLDNHIHTNILELAAQCKIGLRNENKIMNELTNKTKILLEWIQVKKKFAGKCNKKEKKGLQLKSRPKNIRKNSDQKEKETDTAATASAAATNWMPWASFGEDLLKNRKTALRNQER